jgi:hypothetical protein
VILCELGPMQGTREKVCDIWNDALDVLRLEEL